MLLPEDIRAAVLSGDGDHFSAGLDLSELTVRGTVESVHHSRNWHRIFDMFEFGKVPVIAVLHGAVVGGGGEIGVIEGVLRAAVAPHVALPAERAGHPAAPVEIPVLGRVDSAIRLRLPARTG